MFTTFSLSILTDSTRLISHTRSCEARHRIYQTRSSDHVFPRSLPSSHSPLRPSFVLSSYPVLFRSKTPNCRRSTDSVKLYFCRRISVFSYQSNLWFSGEPSAHVHAASVCESVSPIQNLSSAFIIIFDSLVFRKLCTELSELLFEAFLC